MKNQALLILLESVLGKSKWASKSNYAFKCPMPNCAHHKKKLEINLETDEHGENPWACWICKTRGKTIKSLLKKINVWEQKRSEVDLIITPGIKKEYTYKDDNLKLPEEFIQLKDIELMDRVTNLAARHALNYLKKKRGFSDDDILKHNIGFCHSGAYAGRVIIPSYDSNRNLNYFIARDYTEQAGQAYKNPATSVRNAIGLELHINWDAPIILCEGMFDALTIKRNVIPLFGKVIHDILMRKLVISSVDRIYIALDNDAIKDALKYCEELMNYGKEVYLVELDGKDPNKIGFEKFFEIVEKTKPLTFQNLLARKLNVL